MYKTTEELIEAAWANRSPIMNWVGMETAMRTYLKECKLGDMSTLDSVIVLKTFDEILAAFRKCGRELS